MAVKTPWTSAVVTPQPFDVQHNPGNIVNIPSFPNAGFGGPVGANLYQGGTTPEALPAIAAQPPTFKTLISRVMPKKKTGG